MRLLKFIWEKIVKWPLQTLFVLVIRFYQIFISPFLGANCRYTPSCSQYGKEAILKYGPFKGGLMAIRRILRCHPWGGHGHDPVP
ncbi:membrane protein insertion efficiency factor YidD [Sphingobacterium allocomposti]|uniref:membrane protein insertion efficiency factor YidD n=1 Tax=Sphingobacterium allocomposti TaxID=415956 RepID=UPI0011E85A97|nr:membrane protein insertion efficiency factor YidD [Sphingobacterium composti Yoo et al. 2007 non Ten et al. 2007]HLS94945.1 membrane protein insertion efficiency factor YidD [Sphingobacterium sp.]